MMGGGKKSFCCCCCCLSGSIKIGLTRSLDVNDYGRCWKPSVQKELWSYKVTMCQFDSWTSDDWLVGHKALWLRCTFLGLIEK